MDLTKILVGVGGAIITAGTIWLGFFIFGLITGFSLGFFGI